MKAADIHLPSHPDDERREMALPKAHMKAHCKESFWARCLVCGNKTRTKVRADTAMVNFPLYCSKCKKETLVTIAQLKMMPIEEMAP